MKLLRYGPRGRRLGALAAVSTLIVAACSGTEVPVVASEDALGHIHDLAVTDDGTLLAASHLGLYRIEGADRAVLVGDEQHDLMAMTMTDEGEIVASGHPDLRVERYQVDGKLPFLGLVRSTDEGRTWNIEGLLGDADFHAIVSHPDGLFAIETNGQILFLDPTQGWIVLGSVEARDLAIDPTDADRQIATGYDGGINLSADRAVTWDPLAGAPPLIEVEWADAGRVVGAESSGTLWSAPDPAGPWTQIAVGPPEVETFLIDGNDRWWITSQGGSISFSDDEGLSWEAAYVPPSG